jgi:RNA 3'-phosphate cyclase
VIEIDGSHGEGGGQLVRLAVALSALTGKPLRLANVRAGRPRPGLAPQHLAAVRAIAALCGARCEGLARSATAFTFEPRSHAMGGELRVDVGTAGSVTLVLQAVLPILLTARRPSRLVIIGGTDVRKAPTWDYFEQVLLRLLRRMQVRVRASLVRRGYYPRGGGEVVVDVEPGIPRPLVLDAPGAWSIAGAAHVANLPIQIAERMRDAALAATPVAASIEARGLGPDQAMGRGGAITVWAQSEGGVLGASRVAERGVRAEALGGTAAQELGLDMALGATLDTHAADQVLIYLALAGGRSRFRAREITSHVQTAMWLIAQFLPVRYAVEEVGGLSMVSAGAP